MKFTPALATIFALLPFTQAALIEQERSLQELTPREKAKAQAGEGIGKDLLIRVTNLSYQQPFSPFLVVVHSKSADRIFTLGEKASDELAVLAEDGNPEPLADLYNKMQDNGVLYAEVFNTGAPYGGNVPGSQNTFDIPIYVKGVHKYVTIASMIINTNDGFVAMNGVEVYPGLTFTGPVYDGGSERNTELCSDIPGPACPMGSGNARVEDGAEGFVHVSRGFHGVADDLSQAGYDWRNPTLRTTILVDKNVGGSGGD